MKLISTHDKFDSYYGPFISLRNDILCKVKSGQSTKLVSLINENIVYDQDNFHGLISNTNGNDALVLLRNRKIADIETLHFLESEQKIAPSAKICGNEVYSSIKQDGKKSVFSMNRSTGKINWIEPIEESKAIGFVTDDNNLYASNMKASVLCLDKKTGKHKWTFNGDSKYKISPPLEADAELHPHDKIIVTDCCLIVYYKNSHIVAIDKHSGQLKWEIDMFLQDISVLEIVNDELIAFGVKSSIFQVEGMALLRPQDKEVFIYKINLETGALKSTTLVNDDAIMARVINDHEFFEKGGIIDSRMIIGCSRSNAVFEIDLSSAKVLDSYEHEVNLNGMMGIFQNKIIVRDINMNLLILERENA